MSEKSLNADRVGFRVFFKTASLFLSGGSVIRTVFLSLLVLTLFSLGQSTPQTAVTAGKKPAEKRRDPRVLDVELKKALKERFDVVEKQLDLEKQGFGEIGERGGAELVPIAYRSLRARLELSERPKDRIALLKPLLEYVTKIESKMEAVLKVAIAKGRVYNGHRPEPIRELRLTIEIEILRAERQELLQEAD